MMVQTAMIRTTHQYSFRSGEWADLTGVAIVTPKTDDQPRPCYVVRFEDGFVDYWPLEGWGQYQIQPVTNKS